MADTLAASVDGSCGLNSALEVSSLLDNAVALFGCGCAGTAGSTLEPGGGCFGAGGARGGGFGGVVSAPCLSVSLAGSSPGWCLGRLSCPDALLVASQGGRRAPVRSSVVPALLQSPAGASLGTGGGRIHGGDAPNRDLPIPSAALAAFCCALLRTGVSHTVTVGATGICGLLPHADDGVGSWSLERSVTSAHFSGKGSSWLRLSPSLREPAESS
mmetsp:Transcript_15536/g.34283  ORF Transcript_15536/g.34283 Transcript_15536/m.34283 type:complete len:215 (+) Transcript_15536:692-1336(+)